MEFGVERSTGRGGGQVVPDAGSVGAGQKPGQMWCRRHLESLTLPPSAAHRPSQPLAAGLVLSNPIVDLNPVHLICCTHSGDLYYNSSFAAPTPKVV